jgi:hypothetical protein
MRSVGVIATLSALALSPALSPAPGEVALAGDKPPKTKVVLLPAYVKGNMLIVNFGDAKVADATPTPRDKCQVWVDPCPKDGADEKTLHAAAWRILTHDPTAAAKERKPNHFWVVGPPKGGVSFGDVDPERFVKTEFEPQTIQIGSKDARLWKVELKAKGIAEVQIIPVPPPKQTGCWVLADCN